MTPSKPSALRPARTCSLVTLLALLVIALTATAAAAAPVDGPTGAVQSPTATEDQGTATIASATDPTAPGAVVAPADDSATPADPSAVDAPITVPASTPPVAAPVPPETSGNDIRPQPAVLAAGAADAPISRPARVATPSHPTLDAPIISSSPRPPSAPASRATVTQLASGGPIVAAAGTARARRAGRRPPGALPQALLRLIAQRPIAPPIVAVAVSVPIVDVFVGSAAGRPRHIDAKPTGATPQLFGPSGLAAVSVSPFGATPGAPGMPVQFGDAPFSSTGGSMPLLGLDTMLAAMMLLAGITWRRRSWELPVLTAESALLSSALDRPG